MKLAKYLAIAAYIAAGIFRLNAEFSVYGSDAAYDISVACLLMGLFLTLILTIKRR
jgi:hypothetical protein